MAGHVRSPRPRDVPGYAEAAAAGLSPARPSRPPSPLPGTTSHQALIRCGVVLAGAAALVVAALVVGPEEGGQATVREAAIMLGATAVGVIAVIAAVGRFRRVLLSELGAGYVTCTFHQGLFWFVSSPGPTFGKEITAWDWTGVWVLTSDGSVVSAPDLDADPPGFYPSPNRPGQLELWTGSQWTGVNAGGPAPRR